MYLLRCKMDRVQFKQRDCPYGEEIECKSKVGTVPTSIVISKSISNHVLLKKCAIFVVHKR